MPKCEICAQLEATTQCPKCGHSVCAECLGGGLCSLCNSTQDSVDLTVANSNAAQYVRRIEDSTIFTSVAIWNRTKRELKVALSVILFLWTINCLRCIPEAVIRISESIDILNSAIKVCMINILMMVFPAIVGVLLLRSVLQKPYNTTSGINSRRGGRQIVFKVIAWFWILIAIESLVVYNNGFQGSILNIIVFLLALTGGIGLLKGRIFGWWLITAISSLAVVGCSSSIPWMLGNEDILSMYTFVIPSLCGCLYSLIVNRPNQWLLDNNDKHQ